LFPHLFDFERNIAERLQRKLYQGKKTKTKTKAKKKKTQNKLKTHTYFYNCICNGVIPLEIRKVK